MSNAFALSAVKRTDKGKGASRRLRRTQGLTPAIVYGADKEPLNISIIQKDLIKQLQNEAFYAHIIDLNVDGASEKVVLKALQRHPVSNFPIHADFLRVDGTHKLTMHIPLHFINEDVCVGVKQGGGIINHQANDLEVSCLAKDLPEFIEVDLANVAVGQSVHISDIKLPEGVESVALSHGENHDHSIVAVLPPKGGAADGEEEATEEASE